MTEPKSHSDSPPGDGPSGAGPTATNPVSPISANASSAGQTAVVKPSELKLVALDAEDLTVLAAHLQDAVVRVGDMAFLPNDRRFVLLVNRFDWTQPEGVVRPGPRSWQGSAAGQTGAAAVRSFERHRSALRFEHVRAAKISGIAPRNKRQVLSILTVTFEQAREGDPDGYLTLIFAGGGAVRLEVECVEAELRDMGAGWRTQFKPEHPEV